MLAMLLALTACGSERTVAPAHRAVGLFTSLPLLWSESGDIRGQLAGSGPVHWARTALEREGRLVPLDSLTGLEALPRGAVLVLAQPRPLAPEENLALDTWVRAGGRVLLFADPMLTAESAFALGDPRRPQDIVMLSPILRHWGLELEFDPRQPAGEKQVEVFGTALPVELPGRFRLLADAHCRRDGEELAVDCKIGRGRVIAVADAAVFDGEDAGRTGALAELLDRLRD